MTAKRMVSSEILIYRNGLCVSGNYETRFGGSSYFTLTVPFEEYRLLHTQRLEFAVGERPPEPLHWAEAETLQPPPAQQDLQDEDESAQDR